MVEQKDLVEDVATSKQRSRPDVTHLDLDADRLVTAYRNMVLSRKLGDRMLILNRQGRAPFTITGQGHEAAQVGAAMTLRPGKDWLLPYYRDLGMMVTLGMTSRELMLNCLARAEDENSGGVQMPSHWSSRHLRIVTGSSPVITQTLHACGVALASKNRGLNEVALTSFGEGSTSQGDFHEALNFASIHKLPVVFYCQNNGYAITQAQWKEMAVPTVADRATAYGIRGSSVDGNDLLTVYQTVKWAVEECRAGRGPALIEARTYRLVPHSSDDNDRRYRSREEVAEWAARDPIDRFREALVEAAVLDDAEVAEIDAELEEEVRDAVEYAESAPQPAPEDALRHVYGDTAKPRMRFRAV